MGITLDDIRQAVTGDGEVSSLAKIYLQSLGNSPVPINTSFEKPAPLLSPLFLLERIDPKLAKRLVDTARSGQPSPGKIDFQVIAATAYGKNAGSYIEKTIEETHPDIVVVDAGQIDFAAAGLYTFSLPCAIGLPLQAEVKFTASGEMYLSRRFEPGSLCETAILKGWLKNIPVIPVGQPPRKPKLTYIPSQGYVDLNYSENFRWQTNLSAAYRYLDAELAKAVDQKAGEKIAVEVSQDLIKSADSAKREELVDEACYLASRIMDLASAIADGRKIPKILALTDISHYPDLQYLAGLITDGITDEIYAKEKPEPASTGLTFTRSQVENPGEFLIVDSTPLSLAERIYKARFDETIRALDAEILTPEKCNYFVAGIAGRTRSHPEISRGVSVRGTIAFLEVVRGLAEMNGSITRSSIAKAASITIPPRITLKQKGEAGDIVSEIVKEVLYDFRFSGNAEETAVISLRKMTSRDILDKLNEIGQIPKEPNLGAAQGVPPAVVAEMGKNRELLKNLEKMDYIKKDSRGQYNLTRKAIQLMMNELDEKLKTGQLTQDEYNRQKSGLLSKMKSASSPAFKLSSRELANTIMEMIDAQDKQWNREISFQAMHAYYHIKENSEGAELSPEKRDYYALQKLIEDMERRKVLMAAGEASGYMLTGLALNILLKYLIDQDLAGKNVEAFNGRGKALAEEHNHEVRRYSSGDAFRDISVRQTLKQTARQKKALTDIRNSDLRVFLKEPRKPQSDLILCLDTSGSMGFHQKLMYARLVAAGLVQAALQDRNRVGIVAFNDHGQITIPLTDTDKDSLLNCLAGLNARGNTNIGDGIRSSSDLLFRSYNRNQKHIVLISDGQPTALSESSFSRLKGLGEKDLTEESALLETRQAAAKGVQLSVIHIAGQGEANDSFIKNIAKAGKGKVRRITGPEDLKGILK